VLSIQPGIVPFKHSPAIPASISTVTANPTLTWRSRHQSNPLFWVGNASTSSETAWVSVYAITV
jgi:hypothetical protein